MNALTRKTALTLSASLTLAVALVMPAVAAQPKALLLEPGHEYCLPQFGFSSFNVYGVGERVTYVRWGGLASQLGLEPGDLILSMNGFRLNYHGAWNDALGYAVANGGWVQLRIRDVRTGHIALRETFLGSGGGPMVGPITPKMHTGGYHPPIVPHKHGGFPNGPVTQKSKAGGNSHDLNNTIKKIATLFE